MTSSFLLPLVIMIVLCICTFVACLICFCIMKPYKEDMKGKTDLQKLKGVDDRQNSVNNSKLSPNFKVERTWKVEKFEDYSKPSLTGLSMVSNTKTESKQLTNYIGDVSSFKIDIKPANRENYIENENMNTKHWM